jgi:hypothetical protein
MDGGQAWCGLDNGAKRAVLPEMAESKEAVKWVLPGMKNGCRCGVGEDRVRQRVKRGLYDSVIFLQILL